ncbi:hypothetical protein VKI22_01585 [Cyanobacterium aponinum UTEX 3221]|uniref:hypothetical protein n=1 Tax=Cyanobacterium aponinum TaxID=379064 RepID=UPI002B4BDA93|nr:hypothetical protein [Cyanobacterium aponinum]WRL38815.1 hypothetical protein VKI22_01585 [Cyanobacterium aponinum UTEX 3221]
MKIRITANIKDLEKFGGDFKIYPNRGSTSTGRIYFDIDDRQAESFLAHLKNFSPPKEMGREEIKYIARQLNQMRLPELRKYAQSQGVKTSGKPKWVIINQLIGGNYPWTNPPKSNIPFDEKAFEKAFEKVERNK